MDAVLLKALATKAKFSTLRAAVPESLCAPDTMAMLAWYGAYWESFPDRERIDVDELHSLIRLRSGGSTPEQIQVTLALAEQLREPLDEVAESGVTTLLQEHDFKGRAAALIARYDASDEIDIIYEVANLAQRAMRTRAASSVYDYIDTPIGDLLAEVADDKGFKLRRWACTRNNIAGLQGGASVALAARPDKGKTSLVSAIVTDLAPQAVELYGGKRPILWLNNEGSGKRIIPRVYQGALGMNLNQIIELANKGLLESTYAKAIGGVPDLIRVKDMHGATLAQLEQVIEAMNPCVVVADMLSNFRLAGGGGDANKATMIEEIWKEWREILVRQDAVGFGTVQVSVEGGNMLYPPYSALKDSKTGIQGATDIILMMGSLDNPDAQTIRGLSSPKNKFAMPGKPSCFQSEMYFDGGTCTFDDGSAATPQGAPSA